MFYYRDGQNTFCSLRSDLPFEKRKELPENLDRLYCLFERDPENSRAGFAISMPGQMLQKEEGVHWLNSRLLAGGEDAIDAQLCNLIVERKVRAVNYAHPRWCELLAPVNHQKAKRLNLLALGDVGSTLLIGLALLGGDTISSIGICDIDPKMSARWEQEINQIAYPMDYQRIPRVEEIGPEQLFDGDVFVFCASKGVPALDSKVSDVRMAQFEQNRGLIEAYAKMAREKKYKGLFAVVSDPVDPLCKAAYAASNRNESGEYDGLGLLPEQVQGYGLGVMNARAAYFARKDPRFASFFTEGRAFGPHGADLVIANSIEHYNDALSRELTGLAVSANLRIRETGFKPYVAPALSSAAISILLTLRGDWHYSSNFLGGVYMGALNRTGGSGLEVEALPLEAPLYERLLQAYGHLAEII